MQWGNPVSGPTFQHEPKPKASTNVLRRQILPSLKRCVVCGKSQVEHVGSTHGFKLDQKLPSWGDATAAWRGRGSNLYSLDVPEKNIQEMR